MPLRHAAVGCMLAALSNHARAECKADEQPGVELYAGAAELAPMAAALGAGLLRSGIAVCAGEPAAQRVARVDVSRSRAGSTTWRIVVLDDVTHKSVERSIALGGVPEDSRAIALALYVEELLQASWAELALAQRGVVRERAAAEAVKREVASVVPTSPTLNGAVGGTLEDASKAARGAAKDGSIDAARQDANAGSSRDALPRDVGADPYAGLGRQVDRSRVLRVFAGGLAAAHGGGMIQAGVQLGLGVRLASWLDVGLRGAYLHSPSVRATHGRIDAQSAAVGVYVEPVLQIAPALSLRLPQGVELQRVGFRASADRGAGSHAAVRGAVVVSHGVGTSFAFSSSFALSVIPRLCWALLPAHASDDMVIATGLSGLGGQLEILFDATF